MILPAPLRYFAASPVTSTGTKVRGGAGEIISPAFLSSGTLAEALLNIAFDQALEFLGDAVAA